MLLRRHKFLYFVLSLDRTLAFSTLQMKPERHQIQENGILLYKKPLATKYYPSKLEMTAKLSHSMNLFPVSL